LVRPASIQSWFLPPRPEADPHACSERRTAPDPQAVTFSTASGLILPYTDLTAVYNRYLIEERDFERRMALAGQVGSLRGYGNGAIRQIEASDRTGVAWSRPRTRGG